MLGSSLFMLALCTLHLQEMELTWCVNGNMEKVNTAFKCLDSAHARSIKPRQGKATAERKRALELLGYASRPLLEATSRGMTRKRFTVFLTQQLFGITTANGQSLKLTLTKPFWSESLAMFKYSPCYETGRDNVNTIYR